jgi:phosphoribosyl 1,2-cyclic phosphodiesterase
MFNIKFKSLASSSAGNCYVLEGYETKILIECGLTFSKLLKKLDNKFTDIDACIVSHEHMDHCKCHVELANKGIPVHGVEETFKGVENRNFVHHNVLSVSDSDTSPILYNQFTVGEFVIKPLFVDHGEIPSCGYLIKSKLSGEKLLFIIDTFYCPYQIPGVTHYVMEANYSEEMLRNNEDGNKSYIDRLWGSHFSIERLCESFNVYKENGFLKRDAKIWLTHLSDNNADEQMFSDMIHKTTGITPTICER